jgi:hypothetical protein
MRLRDGTRINQLNESMRVLVLSETSITPAYAGITNARKL